MNAAKVYLLLFLLIIFAGASFGQSKLPLSNRQQKAFRAAYPELVERFDHELDVKYLVENPFFINHRILRLRTSYPFSSLNFVFAIDKKGGITPLTYKGGLFFEFVKKETLQIREAEEAVQYITFCLQINSSPSEGCWIVQQIESIKFIPNLDGERDATKRAFESKYKYVLKPMTATPIEDGFELTYFQIRYPNLEKITIKLRTNGIFEAKIEVAERNLPLVALPF